MHWTSPNTVISSTRSLQRCHYIYLSQHQSCELQYQVIQLGVKFISQQQSCCPKVAPQHLHSWIATRQCCGYSLSHHQGKLHSLTGSHSALLYWEHFTAPSQFNPFCSQVFFPSTPDHSLGHELPLLKSDNLNFPFSIYRPLSCNLLQDACN